MQTASLTSPILISPLQSVSSRAISLANRNGRPKGSARGALVASKGPRRLAFFESAIEYKTLLLMLARRDVEEIQEQQVVHYVDEHGTPRKHIFDMRVKFTSGDWMAVAVKPFERAMRTGFVQSLEWIAKQVPRRFAKKVVLITDRDFSAAELHNAELIHACRLDPDPDSDAAVRRSLQAMRSPLSIDQLIDRAELQCGVGFRAVVRLIANGELEMVRRVRIAHSELVVHPSTSVGDV